MRRSAWGILEMLRSKKQLNKMKKLQDARRAYIEQLAFIRQFKKDDEGGLIILTLLLLISMLVVGGMATDFMRYESERTKLQSVSDRAVLAAASLNQTVGAADVIENFFEVEGYGGAITTDLTNPDSVDRSDSNSAITIESQVSVDTFYLRLIGMDTLTAPASSSAIAGSGNVEVSLVLDISGSMGNYMRGDVFEVDADGKFVYHGPDHPTRAGLNVIEFSNARRTRMFFLQQAAKQFVADLLLPEYEDSVSINLVAYSAHVALSDELYMALNTTADSVNEDDKLGSSFGTYNISGGYSEPYEYVYVDFAGVEVIRVNDLNQEIAPESEFGRWVYKEPDGSGNYVDVSATAPAPTLRGTDDIPLDIEWADGKDINVNPARCVTFEADEYKTTVFDVDRTYRQVPYAHMSRGWGTFNTARAQCPARDFEGIVLLSQDLEKLQETIDQYVPTLTTSIHRGMKWGSVLLDPSITDLVADLPSVDPAFAGRRPAEYTDGTTNKYVVIMTDGFTVSSRDIKDEFYLTYADREGFSKYTAGRWAGSDGDGSTDYWNMSETIGSTTVLNRDYLAEICDATALRNVDVYTISMGVQNQTMTDCASKPGNAFLSTITNDPTKQVLARFSLASQTTSQLCV